MKIALIGKFKRMHDEEYIARSFEILDHKVCRIYEGGTSKEVIEQLEDFGPDLVVWTKLMVPQAARIREHCRKYKTVCWVFDLYWGYEREYRMKNHPAFTADFVFTTDGGHDAEFAAAGIKHQCIRQGIYKQECFYYPPEPEDLIVFVGSENPLHGHRQKQMSFLEQEYGEKFKWIGRNNTEEIRGLKLNELFMTAKIVVGDSVYSPYYWSNRVVETLGRGGFLIHQEVPGLKEEYPDLVTYPRGDFAALKKLIDFYLTHEDERRAIIKKNFEWVRSHYTMEKKCAELLKSI